MSSFSPTDAALEGVRLSRERPGAILIWAAYYLAFTILLGVVARLTLGSNADGILAMLQKPPTDSEAYAKAMEQAWPFVALALPLGLIFQAMFTGAVYRCILGVKQKGDAWLRLGTDELRQLALKLVMAAIWTVILFVGLFTVATAGVGASQVATALGMAVDLGLIWLGLLIWVRLSLAGPATFVERRIVIFQSWPLTHGQFWRLIGCYVIAFALAVVVFVLMAVIASALIGLGAKAGGIPLDQLTIQTTNPLVLVLALASEVVTCLMLTCFYVTMLAPAAQAYRDLIGKR